VALGLRHHQDQGIEPFTVASIYVISDCQGEEDVLKTGCKQLSWGVRQVRYTCVYLNSAEARSEFRDKIAQLRALSVLPLKCFSSTVLKPIWCQCSWRAPENSIPLFQVRQLHHPFITNTTTIPSIVVFNHDRVLRLPLTFTDSVDSIYSYSLTGEDYLQAPAKAIAVSSYLST
jgi:hypothetical protein